MFVMDASASTGEMGLDEMWGMAGTMLELFNVQKTGYTASVSFNKFIRAICSAIHQQSRNYYLWQHGECIVSPWQSG